MNEQPRYQHDCDETNGCKFVGHIGNADLWFHEYTFRIGDEEEKIDTCVIMRYSDKPDEYGSWSTAYSSSNPNWIPDYWEEAIARVVQYKFEN